MTERGLGGVYVEGNGSKAVNTRSYSCLDCDRNGGSGFKSEVQRSFDVLEDLLHYCVYNLYFDCLVCFGVMGGYFDLITHFYH